MEKGYPPVYEEFFDHGSYKDYVRPLNRSSKVLHQTYSYKASVRSSFGNSTPVLALDPKSGEQSSNKGLGGDPPSGVSACSDIHMRACV